MSERLFVCDLMINHNTVVTHRLTTFPEKVYLLIDRPKFFAITAMSNF